MEKQESAIDYSKLTTEELRSQRTTAIDLRRQYSGDSIETINTVIGWIEDELHKRGEPVVVGLSAFKKPSQIRFKKRDLSNIIQSGIIGIDKKLKGFDLGQLTVWSGSNGSGKSSVLSQMAIDAIQEGKKVAIFSGELGDYDLMDWIHLQAAGLKYCEPTDTDNFYKVDYKIRNRINEWLDDRLYVYDNDSGLKAGHVLTAIDECISEFGINLVIIDNLMCLDLSLLKGDKYENQSKVIASLSQMAKNRNVHIHFVAHPKKSMAFLRKEDISGSADLSNLADNVFIVHRVDNDFKIRFKEYLGIKEDSPYFRFSNIIEICKTRYAGIKDEFVGVFYQKETKRFLNFTNEQKHYGWEQDKDGFVEVDEELKFE